MGLWFELPVQIATTDIHIGIFDRMQLAKGGPHVTIVHFGDLELESEAHADELRDVAQLVVAELREEFEHAGPYTLNVTGSGRFLVGPKDWPVDVLLVQAKELGILYDTLKYALESRMGINVDDTYQWVPHVTLGKGDPVTLARSFKVTATTLDLVHSKGGKERGRWRTPL